jgi:hypothetical protein
MIADGWLDQDFRTSNGNNAEIQFPHPPQNLEYTSQILKKTQKKKKKKGKNHGLSHNPNIISIKQLANPGVEGWDSETSPFSVPPLGKSTRLKLRACLSMKVL